jgi:phytanoyl-CoA hydroxylase
MDKEYNLETLKNHYTEKGWVILKNFINLKEINEIKLIIEDFIKKRINQSQNPRSINFTDDSKNLKNLNSFHELGDNKEIKKFGNSKRVTEIVKFFLNSDPEYRQSELFAKPARNGLASPDHQDNYYWAVEGSNALTVWIALDKAEENNGAMHYYDGSHKFGIFEHEGSYAKGSSQTIKDKNYLSRFKKTQPNLEAGDALIHHCLVVHGSSVNKSNCNRQGWTIQFKDKHAIYNIEQKKKYEASLEKQIKIRC